jgi:raffinose/stachyose/melibiose transport system permease protein
MRDRSKGYGKFLIPGFILFVLVLGVPFLMSLCISFTQWTGVGKPTFVGLSNYRKLFHDPVFWASFSNNLQLIFAITVVPTIIGLRFPCFCSIMSPKCWETIVTNIFKTAYYLPQVLPVAIAGIVWGWILNPTQGALNSLLKAIGLGALAHNWLGDPATALHSVMVIMIWFQIGYPLVIFLSGLQRSDPQVIEAAEVDGAGWFEKFKIYVYMIRPELLVVILTSLIYSLKLFSQIYVLTRGGPGTATIVPSYFAYQTSSRKPR